ncbi:MAG TPA: hypothetical protein VFL97_02315, partial [Nitrococcus sp.]|nr:hypothetical protein [Nitrococcus sp.]
MQRQRRAQLQGIWADDRLNPVVMAAHPRRDLAVAEPENGLHLHRYLALPALDDAHQIDDLFAIARQRHEV